MSQCARQIRLAAAGCPENDQIYRVADPATCSELGQGGTGNATSGAAVDILDIGANPKLRLTQMRLIASRVPMLAFALEQHGEAIIEAELIDIGDVSMFLRGLGHAAEAKLKHSLDVRLAQCHEAFPLL